MDCQSGRLSLIKCWTFPRAVGSQTWQLLYFKVIVVACVPSEGCVLSRAPSNIGKGEKEGYKHLNAEFQRIARRDKKWK